jgi:hypothetical protein
VPHSTTANTAATGDHGCAGNIQSSAPKCLLLYIIDSKVKKLNATIAMLSGVVMKLYNINAFLVHVFLFY